MLRSRAKPDPRRLTVDPAESDAARRKRLMVEFWAYEAALLDSEADSPPWAR